MSTVSSSLNSLASASTHDFYAALTGRTDAGHLLKVGRGMTLLWAAILVGGAMLFRDRNTPVVVLALSIASITYGGLLGSYLLGGLWPRARQADVIIAIVAGVAVMIPVVLGFPRRLLPGLAWPWYVPLGTTVTVLVGMMLTRPEGLAPEARRRRCTALNGLTKWLSTPANSASVWRVFIMCRTAASWSLRA